MGSGSKIKHENYVVAPAAGTTLAPDSDGEVTDDAEQLIETTDFQGSDIPVQAAGFTSADTQATEIEAQWNEAFGGDDTVDIGEWKSTGIYPNEAGAWHDMGISPAVATEWDQSGFDPETATKYVEQGMNPVQAMVEEFEKEHEEEPAVEAVSTDSVTEEVASQAAPEPSPFDAEKISDAEWGDAVTPVPDVVPVGDPNGVALLIGGADLDGSSATIIAYADPKGGDAREVLFTTVTPEAEAKLLEALAPTEEKLIPQEVQVEKSGPIAFDSQNNFFSELQTAAISVNHHLKEQDGMPEHTVERIETLKNLLDGINVATATDEEKAMVEHYKPLVASLQERIKPDFKTPYEEGGKSPQVTQFETTWTETETEWVKDPNEGPTGSDKLSASARSAGRVHADMVDGQVVWNGKSRNSAGGIEYVIDLPNGYTAVYHPYSYEGQKAGSDPYSLRGQLELHCPGGEGHAKELVDVLGSLNIVNRPMNQSEGEWTYLMKNIEAQGLGSSPEVAQAVTNSAAVVEHVNQTVLFKHQDEATALYQAGDMDGIEKLARRITLEAEAAALPRRVRMVRDAVAKATGYANGKELKDDPAYSPRPRRSGGWMVFDRFDVAKQQESLNKTWDGKNLYCSVTGKGSGGSLLDIFQNGGVLASTERRQIMGVKVSTMSPGQDMQTGGAKSVFLRAGTHDSSPNTIVWDKPVERLLRRTDWYAFKSDHFGSINPNSSHSVSGMTRNPAQVAGHTSSSNNEIMFQDGLDLLGVDAPSRINCSTKGERDKIRKLLKDRGVTHIGVRTVEEVVVHG